MNKRILLVYANTMMETVLSVNISSLATCLQNAGFEVKLFDTTFYRWAPQSATEKRVEHLQIKPSAPGDDRLEYKQTDIMDDFRKTVLEFDPLVVGVSVVEPTYELGLALLNHVKDLGVPTIMGGVHVIMAPDLVINESAVDMVCVGEGEIAFVELCRRMSAGEDPKGIANIWVKENGQVHKSEKADLIDIDALPYFDFSFYEDERLLRPMTGKIYKTIIVETSRGCPYTCSYCADRSLALKFKEQGRWYREKNVERIIDEIKHYVEHFDAEYLYIMSESFLATNKKRFERFVELYSDIGLPFWCQTRPENLTPEKAKQLESINCHRISMGIEHGNPDFRKNVLKRYVSNDRIIRSCEMLENSTIGYSVNNIIGFPDETRELVFDTINLNRKINADGTSVHIFTPYRGTELRTLCVEKGYIDPELVASDFFIETCLDMPQLTKDEIMGLYRTFPLYVKLPEEYFGDIGVAEKFDDQGNRKFAELRKVYLDNYSD